MPFSLPNPFVEPQKSDSIQDHADSFSAVQSNFDSISTMQPQEFIPIGSLGPQMMHGVGPQIVQVGPIAGNGGSLSTAGGNWIALPGFAITTTFPTNVAPGSVIRCQIFIDVTYNCTVAAWTFALTGLSISPAPVSRGHTNAAAGTGTSGPNTLATDYLHNAGPVLKSFLCFETVTVNPGATHTFQVTGNGGGTGSSIVWYSGTDNYMYLMYWLAS